MKNAGWVLSAVLALALAGVVVHFQSVIAQKDSEIEGVKKQYSDLAQEANGKLEEARSKYNDLVNEANQKLSAASQPEVPVSVGFRGALLSSGSVARITNNSGRSIAVTINISRPASGDSKSYDTVIDGGMTKEIGEQEGWAFVSGDSVTVEQAGHKSLSWSMR